MYLLSRPVGHVRDVKIYTEGNNINISLEGSAKIALADRDGKLLKEQEHPGGIMGYTFKSWGRKERGLDFYLNPRNPERWTKFEAAMREIHDKIKNIEIK